MRDYRTERHDRWPDRMGVTDPSSLPLWRGRTAWARERAAPLRAFLRTESGSAGVLLAAAVAALIWANIDFANYERIWHANSRSASATCKSPATCAPGSTTG